MLNSAPGILTIVVGGSFFEDPGNGDLWADQRLKRKAGIIASISTSRSSVPEPLRWNYLKPSSEFARLDHIGIAVNALTAARPLYEALGLAFCGEEIVEHERVRVAMFQLGDSRIELLEPTSLDSVVSTFIAKRGEGLHHIAIKADDIEGLFNRLASTGVRLTDTEIKVGAGGHRYFFIHPSSAGGVLIEIVE